MRVPLRYPPTPPQKQKKTPHQTPTPTQNRVLGRPGVRVLVFVFAVLRMPIAAAPLLLTLHVVLELNLGFAKSGLVAAAMSIGTALGAPLAGAGVDRLGLRTVMIVTTASEVLFWATVQYLPYP